MALSTAGTLGLTRCRQRSLPLRPRLRTPRRSPRALTSWLAEHQVTSAPAALPCIEQRFPARRPEPCLCGCNSRPVRSTAVSGSTGKRLETIGPEGTCSSAVCIEAVRCFGGCPRNVYAKPLWVSTGCMLGRDACVAIGTSRFGWMSQLRRCWRAPGKTTSSLCLLTIGSTRPLRLCTLAVTFGTVSHL